MGCVTEVCLPRSEVQDPRLPLAPGHPPCLPHPGHALPWGLEPRPLPVSPVRPPALHCLRYGPWLRPSAQRAFTGDPSAGGHVQARRAVFPSKDWPLGTPGHCDPGAIVCLREGGEPLRSPKMHVSHLKILELCSQVSPATAPRPTSRRMTDTVDTLAWPSGLRAPLWPHVSLRAAFGPLAFS